MSVINTNGIFYSFQPEYGLRERVYGVLTPEGQRQSRSVYTQSWLDLLKLLSIWNSKDIDNWTYFPVEPHNYDWRD